MGKHCSAVSGSRISVFVLSYNFEEYIEECIRSLLAQTLKPFEIIICDDCSTDRSWEIIQEYADQYPGLIRAFRHDKNIGMRENGTFARKQTRGEYIVGVDGDDVFYPRKLELEIKALVDNPAARIAYSNVEEIDEDGRSLNLWKNGASGDLFYRIFRRQVFDNTGNPFRNELVHRSVYNALGERDNNLELLLDMDFKYQASARYEIVCTGQTLVKYRLHGKGIHDSSSPRTFDRDILIIYKKMLPLVSSRMDAAYSDMRKEIESRIGIIESQLRYDPSYHFLYADLPRKNVGFDGKDVLEVGCHLPETYVFNQLNVRSWSCVEATDYDLSAKKESEIVSNEPFAGNMKPEKGEYKSFSESIDCLSEENSGCYDLVFSIGGFECITNLPGALDKMYMALKPGGRLFAVFAPIWSAHDGHHLPEIRDKYGKVFNTVNYPVPPWGHLIMNPADLCRYLYRFTDRDTAARMVYLVYNSPRINRLFPEDYLKFFKQSQFNLISVENISFVGTQEKTRRCLETLYPGRNNFTNGGMQVILEKPSTDPGNMAEAIYLNQRGEDLFEKGRFEEALDMFSKSIASYPQYAASYNNMGVILWNENALSEAIEYFLKALEIEPGNRDAVINAASCLESVGGKKDARSICESYLGRGKEDEEVEELLVRLNA